MASSHLSPPPTQTLRHYCIPLQPRLPSVSHSTLKYKAKTSLKICAAKTLNPITAAAATAAAAAALLFAGIRSPAFASVSAPPPPAVSDHRYQNFETLADADKERLVEDHLDRNPHDVKSLRVLLELKIKANKLDKAVEVIDRLIALKPEEKALPLLKLTIQANGVDIEAAKRGYEEMIEKDPFSVEAYHGLVMAAYRAEDYGQLQVISKRLDDVMELCRKAKKMDDLRDFKLLVAQISTLEQKFEDSIKIYEELVKQEPKDFRPYLCQGIIYTIMGKKDEADKQFEKYKRFVPKDHRYAEFFDEGMLAMKMLRRNNDRIRTTT